jgi:hypothetical protein
MENDFNIFVAVLEFWIFFLGVFVGYIGGKDKKEGGDIGIEKHDRHFKKLVREVIEEYNESQ